MNTSTFVGITLWASILIIIFGLLSGIIPNTWMAWFFLTFLCFIGFIKYVEERPVGGWSNYKEKK